MDPILPQTNPAGGPNPNTAVYNSQSPQQSWGMSVLDYANPNAALDGQTRAGALGLAQAGQSGKIGALMNATTGPGALPAFNPNDPNLVSTPANGVQPQSGASRLASFFSPSPQSQFDQRLAYAGADPHTMVDAIKNWWSNAPGSPEAQRYEQEANANATFRTPEAKQYFGAHPSLLAHAEADPVGFATKLGPILDAAVAAHQHGVQTGQIVHNTIDGPMIKPDNNPAHTIAVSKAFNVSPQVAHAAMQPHGYTRDEFIAATRGMTNNQLKQMWEMQHYLNPQQQAMSMALASAQARANDPHAAPMNEAQKELDRRTMLAAGMASPLPIQ